MKFLPEKLKCNLMCKTDGIRFEFDIPENTVFFFVNRIPKVPNKTKYRTLLSTRSNLSNYLKYH